jgi:hypothetical protein
MQRIDRVRVIANGEIVGSVPVEVARRDSSSKVQARAPEDVVDRRPGGRTTIPVPEFVALRRQTRHGHPIQKVDRASVGDVLVPLFSGHADSEIRDPVAIEVTGGQCPSEKVIVICFPSDEGTFVTTCEEEQRESVHDVLLWSEATTAAQHWEEVRAELAHSCSNKHTGTLKRPPRIIDIVSNSTSNRWKSITN